LGISFVHTTQASDQLIIIQFNGLYTKQELQKMNQPMIFLIAIGVVGIMSTSFYLYRYSTINANNRYLLVEGNFTEPVSIRQAASLVNSLKIGNFSSSSINDNESKLTNSSGFANNSQNQDQANKMDFDRNLVDTLSEMVISTLERSNQTSHQLVNSSESQIYRAGIENYIVNGHWNASIVGRKMANITGIINTKNLLDANSKSYLFKLDVNKTGIDYVSSGNNMTVLVRGDAELKSDSMESKVPTAFILYKNKDVYLLMQEGGKPEQNRLFVYGLISKTSG